MKNIRILNMPGLANSGPSHWQSLLLASTNDRYTAIETSAQLAQNWGSKFINIGVKGHINANSNLGNWNEGIDYLNEFIKTKLDDEITENHFGGTRIPK